MKLNKYISPEVVVTSVIEAYSILEASGDMDPSDLGAKQNEEIEEVEIKTGVPTKFTNIWDDEE